MLQKTQIFLSLLLVIIALSSCQNDKVPSIETETNEVEEIINHKYFYDIIIDSLEVEEFNISEGQRFTDILKKHGFSIGQIFKIKESAKGMFNFNRVKTNHHYYLLKDRKGEVQYFVYDITVTNFIACKLGEDIEAYLGENEVEIIERSLGGIVDSSLYGILEENEIHESVGDALVDVYAWTVDFHKIQKGDYFKIIYNEKIVNDKSAGVAEIVAALINHKGKDYYAFRYTTKDSITRYYDKDGKSIYGHFLKSPVKFGRITSRYTMKRYHPVEHKVKAHLGTDYAAPLQAPIRATADGMILADDYGKFNGNYIKIKHDDTYTTGYLHMTSTASGIDSGTVVKQGDIIGYVGTTGSSSGPHVCYRFWKNGQQVDHIREQTKMHDSIPLSEYGDYLEEVLDLSKQLNSISTK